MAGTSVESAHDFIKRKQAQFKRELDDEKPRCFKDIGRKGKHCWLREAWTFQAQHNLPEKVFVIERFRFHHKEGKRAHQTHPGDIEYRIGYWIVGKIGSTRGSWIWGQYSLLIPARDLGPLLRKAKRERTIRLGSALNRWKL